MKLYVVRHGEVQSNVEKIISGWNDEELTQKGIEQANEMRSKLKSIPFDEIYSSPIIRAKQTAEIIVPNKNIIYDKRLAERDPGSMLGKSRKEINKNLWNSLDFDRTSEGAETLAAGLKRVNEFLEEKRKIYSDKTLLIITHMYISKCIWVLENNIQNIQQINEFFHSNSEVKYYDEEEIFRARIKK